MLDQTGERISIWKDKKWNYELYPSYVLSLKTIFENIMMKTWLWSNIMKLNQDEINKKVKEILKDNNLIT